MARQSDHSEKTYTLADLQIQPIDLMYGSAGQSPDGKAGPLTYQFSNSIRELESLSIDAALDLNFHDRPTFKNFQLSLAELMPYLHSLRRLIEKSRTLTPEDFLPAGESDSPTGNEQLQVSQHPAFIRLREHLFAQANVEGSPAQLLSKLEAARDALHNLFSSPDFLATSDQARAAVGQLRNALFHLTTLGMNDALPGDQSQQTALLLAQANRMANVLKNKLNHARSLAQNLGSKTYPPRRFAEEVQEVASALFGKNFRVFPSFTLQNAGELQATLSVDYQAAMADEMALEEWLQGVALVRGNMQLYQQFDLLREAVRAEADDQLTVFQFPKYADTSSGWYGLPMQEGQRIPPGAMALAFEMPDSLNALEPVGGFVVDEWSESIPERSQEIGVAMHLRQPISEPPQAMLLAVAPQLNGSWFWEELCQTVQQAFEMAKKRAVDPGIIREESVLAQYLPAMLVPVDEERQTATTDFIKNFKA